MGEKKGAVPGAESVALVCMTPLPATEANVAVAERFVTAMTTDQKAPPEVVRAVAQLAVTFGLHPLANEVMIYEGKPYVTIDGRRRLAQRNKDFAAVQPDIVTDDRRRRALGATQPGDIVAECKLWRNSTPMPTVQYGLVRQHERWPSPNERQAMEITNEEYEACRQANDPDAILPLIKRPQAKVRPVIVQPTILAMKRAEARCLQCVAAVPLPTFDTELQTPLEDQDVVDTTAREVEEEAAPAAAAEAPPAEAPPAPAAPAAGPPPDAGAALAGTPLAKGRAEPIAAPAEPPPAMPPEGPPTTTRELLMAAVQRLGFKNHAQVLRALNVETVDQITDVAGAWGKLIDVEKRAPRRGGAAGR